MMNSKIKMLFLGLASTALLAGCGGTTVNATVGGTVNGLSGGTTVILVNNGSDPITVGSNGSFTFDVQIASNSAYNVTVQTQPIGETCAVVNGTGTVDGNGDEVTSVVVNCNTTL